MSVLPLTLRMAASIFSALSKFWIN